MRYLIFGTGDYYDRYKKWFKSQEVLALLDNSHQKQHTFIDGIEVLSPEEGIQLPYDAIIILSFYVKQMKQQLISLGVEDEKIFHFYDLHQLMAQSKEIRSIQYYLDAKKIIELNTASEPKILLISNDLALGGPSIALMYAALILKKHRYNVVYASMLDGPLRESLIENGISVVVDENLQLAVMKEIAWVKTFSMILCNTLNFHVFLSERDTDIPIIWWLHDARFFYDGVNRNVIGKINLDNLKAVSAGPVPAEAIKEFLPNLVCDELIYGVEDSEEDNDKHINSKATRFITIGFLEERKGQDILLQAIHELPDDIRNSSEFYIVGHNNTLFGEKISKESEDVGNIIITGSVDRKKIHEMLSASDILICPSRQDPMPTVAAEAMMHSVPCIVSDITGTAAYIHDGDDGFVFQCENAHALAEKIEWCVNNKYRLESMGKKARTLYENRFSMATFEKRFLEITEVYINECK
ncbi:MAG: glycosyltransferase family 4 protein [Lachnospiraceae bacterium]|nr:glycosyltransferase family 4 protein [Lachnospiraceae bacterium]